MMTLKTTLTTLRKTAPHPMQEQVVRTMVFCLWGVRSGLTTSAGIGDSKKKKKKKKPKKKSKLEQTEPPTVGLTKLYPDGKFPEGELQEYKNE